MQVAHGICCAAGRSLVANQLLLRCTEGCGSQHLLCSDGPAVVTVGGARTCTKPLFVCLFDALDCILYLGFNVFCSVCIAKCVAGFFKGSTGRAHMGYHDCPTISS